MEAATVIANPDDRPAARIARFAARLPMQIVMAAIALLWLVPTFGLLLTSLMPAGSISQEGWWKVVQTPSMATLDNYRALFDNRVVRGFLSAIPGLDAYAMLGKAWWHTTEETKSSARRWVYDLVILDGPASGHATAMLKIPRAILDAVPAGPLARDARTMSELLSDATRTALVIVTRPEELPAGETVELAATARGALKIPLGPVIVNAVPPSRAAGEPLSSAVDRLRGITDDERLARTVALAAGQRAQRRTAEAVLAALEKDPGLPLVTLPWLPSTALGPAEIDRLASALAASPDIAAPA